MPAAYYAQERDKREDAVKRTVEQKRIGKRLINCECHASTLTLDPISRDCRTLVLMLAPAWIRLRSRGRRHKHNFLAIQRHMQRCITQNQPSGKSVSTLSKLSRQSHTSVVSGLSSSSLVVIFSKCERR